MNALKPAQAGTLESNDIMITVAPGSKGSGVVIELESNVLTQYGQAIKQAIAAVAARQNVTDVYIKAVDRGALDCTIQARTLTALSRAGIILQKEMI
ncbi:citrate lyase acyl carrier protein [Sporomusa sphaeroides]|uniref:Citrate lyase acyl carrier protein n=1 Tax=Sporomusa sphaeroides DSM 2875 TaxID=1337886 RepID=A0ABM9W7U8_9FIRM|nr:citrate lyase acyl carrier protein [Sporomusa sphaeroides]OLS54957.1 citrate lyase acyl carrier protein [Sporomusa sphaeroides DSM 2875]CVK21248.1 Citrate lyase acyl carrier protein [Sporomusa sphaeroides DSM 2875]